MFSRNVLFVFIFMSKSYSEFIHSFFRYLFIHILDNTYKIKLLDPK